MLEAYRKHVEERAAEGVIPKPLSAEQVNGLIELLKAPPAGEEAFLLDLITNRVPPGVDDAAYVKAGFLSAITRGEAQSPLINRSLAVELLGGMHGGYNVKTLIDLLDDTELAALAAQQLKHTLLVFDAFHDVDEKAKVGNDHARAVIQSWAEAEWFTKREPVPESMTLTAFFVEGETNTDDLSPAQDAWSRPDIPLHAKAMYKNPRPGISNAEAQIEALKQKGHPIAFIGDVVGTGSSRKSATNSVLWYIGEDIPGVPNKRSGGVCIGGKVAPIFYNTMEDSGALVFEADVTNVEMGHVIEIRPYEGKMLNKDTGEETAFELKSEVLLDEVRAGGRINLIIGRGLTSKARESLGLPPSDIFRKPENPES
ncbi:MAG: aconitate hydratase B, partial [Pseudomonadales bacterium]|nr:aconitate hydratase B [Pseudomonadales bacterium]